MKEPVRPTFLTDPEAHLDGPLGVPITVPSPNPGEFWRHFKGGVYRIETIAMVESTGDRVVVYSGDSGTWTRPLSEFLGSVSRDGYDGPRFVPEVLAYQRELEALRRVVRAIVQGSIGKAVGPNGATKHWWGACGYLQGATLPEVLSNIAASSEDPSKYLEEMAAVEAALKNRPLKV